MVDAVVVIVVAIVGAAVVVVVVVVEVDDACVKMAVADVTTTNVESTE